MRPDDVLDQQALEEDPVRLVAGDLGVGPLVDDSLTFGGDLAGGQGAHHRAPLRVAQHTTPGMTPRSQGNPTRIFMVNVAVGPSPPHRE